MTVSERPPTEGHSEEAVHDKHGTLQVVITGASAGIGRALAREMAARSHAPGLTACRMALLEQARDEIMGPISERFRRV